MKSLAGLLVVLFLAIGAWLMTSPRNSWRYKMTLEVETPQGVRTGYAVREVTYRRRSGFFLVEGTPQWKVKGQAVVINLPNGKTLFALLRGAGQLDVNYGARIADHALGDGSRVKGWPGPVDLYPSAPNSGALKDKNPLPILVTFADPLDSKSVMLVDPHDLESTFGPGHALRRISIDIVNEPITSGIQHLLPWLTRTEERRLDPAFKGSANPKLAEKLRHGDFLEGSK